MDKAAAFAEATAMAHNKGRAITIWFCGPDRWAISVHNPVDEHLVANFYARVMPNGFVSPPGRKPVPA